MPWTPHAGQIKGVKFLLEHAAAGLFADPGVGKTSIVYAAFKMLKKRGVAHKMLVVAPLRPAFMVWPYEQEKWLDFKDLKVVVLHGPKKEKLLASDADVYVINPEGIDWLLGAVRVKSPITNRVSVTADMRRFRSFGFDTLVVDELSKFKHPRSGRHKALKNVLNTFARRWGLTGSPAANGLMDLFGECYILDVGRSLGPYITHFRSKYFLPSANGVSWNLRKDADKEIYARIAPLVLRLDANDYIDMPEMVVNKIVFDLPPDIRDIYDCLEQDMIIKLKTGNIITAANAGVATMKCRQITSGGIYLDAEIEKLLGKLLGKKRNWEELHSLKIDMLEDLVDELQGEPLLVAYDFKHDLDRLKKRFGKDVPYIGGGVTPKRSAELESLWNRGKLPLLLGHPQSVGHGLNLQGAGHHVCWHTLSYNFDTTDQFVRRVWRQGNTRRQVFVHYLIARNTVDEIIYQTLREKDHTQKRLLDALRDMRK